MDTGQARTEVSTQPHPVLTQQSVLLSACGFWQSQAWLWGWEQAQIDANNSKHKPNYSPPFPHPPPPQIITALRLFLDHIKTPHVIF